MLRPSDNAHQPDRIDRQIINRLQDGFPICDRPYAQAAAAIGIEEDELIERLTRLLDHNVLTRFGPMYNAERMGGAVTLAAMRIPRSDFQRVVDQVNAFSEVAHNYERAHALNMWFVLATETPAEIKRTIDKIERVTGYPVYNLPKLHEFYIGLRLEV